MRPPRACVVLRLPISRQTTNKGQSALRLLGGGSLDDRPESETQGSRGRTRAEETPLAVRICRPASAASAPCTPGMESYRLPDSEPESASGRTRAPTGVSLGVRGLLGNPVLKTPSLERLHEDSATLVDYHVSPLAHLPALHWSRTSALLAERYPGGASSTTAPCTTRAVRVTATASRSPAGPPFSQAPVASLTTFGETSPAPGRTGATP